ncbi:hypothetical protein ADL00_00230 [Streptomyces sp. AS58]|nr:MULTISPECIES: ATP-binding protein [Streptomyces]KOV74786.1 hypothetical protein ADL00_00230 [Streptomyces sp. AS58]
MRSWALPHRSRSVGAARDLARSAVEEWGLPADAADHVLLVVSELVTNAVEHATPPVVLHLDLLGDGVMHIRVDDGGRSAEEGEWTSSCAPDEHGRGQHILDVLTLDHGTHDCRHGATHWARVPAAVQQCT